MTELEAARKAAMRRFGVYVGRLSPMHLGHQAQIDGLLRDFGDDHLVLIGSCNKAISFRHLFSYQDRAAIVHAVYPGLRLGPLADFEDDPCWFRALDDILQLAGINPAAATFVGGCQEDISFFIDAGREVKILNRFGGETPKVSATEVRDALIERRSIDGMVDPRVHDLIRTTFDKRWAALSKL